MFRIAACVTEYHDFRLVLAAAAICLFGCYTSLSVVSRVQGQNGVNWQWMGAASVVLGAAIWATHFVAMLAYQTGFVAGYDLALTALSAALAAGLTFAAFAIAIRFRRPTLGGLMFATAIASMHFTGMTALKVPARFEWDPIYVGTSLAMGAAFGVVSTYLMSRGTRIVWRLITALLMTLAIAGLHFTAMAALTLVPDPTIVPPSDFLLTPHWVPVAVTAVIAIAALGLVGSAFDRHLAACAVSETARLRAYVAELEETKRVLQQTSENLTDALDAAGDASRAKSQFLATMSHELRTPLNAIIGFSDMMAMEIYGPLGSPRYSEYIKDIKDSGRHLLGLVNDVLDFSKVDAGRLDLEDDIIEIAATVRAVLRMVDGEASLAGVNLVTKLDPDLPMLRADERRMRQVLLNLLSNAIKFTPAGGRVVVSAFEEDSSLVLRVTDNGIGIASEDIPRALERFGRISSSWTRNQQGTGLGLPLSKRLMELHGGTLEIESALRIGTTVTVRFPAGRKIAERATA